MCCEAKQLSNRNYLKGESPYPLPFQPAQCSAHFSTREFFKDSPWLKVPLHRKADILIEPLYPRLGLLGGAQQEGTGKMSKLAALAAARKKKEAEKNKASQGASAVQESAPSSASEPPRSTSISLLDRLGGNGKPRTGSETRTPRFPLRKLDRQKTSPEPKAATGHDKSKETSQKPKPPSPEPPASVPTEKTIPSAKELTAQPSSFAAVLIGNESSSESPYCFSNGFDTFKIHRPDLTEIFNFTEPSPDDIVLNAQNAAKGQSRNFRNSNCSANCSQ